MPPSQNQKIDAIEKLLKDSQLQANLLMAEVNALLHDADKCTKTYLLWSALSKKKRNIIAEKLNKMHSRTGPRNVIFQKAQYFEFGHNWKYPWVRLGYLNLLPRADVQSHKPIDFSGFPVMVEPLEALQRAVADYLYKVLEQCIEGDSDATGPLLKAMELVFDHYDPLDSFLDWVTNLKQHQEKPIKPKTIENLCKALKEPKSIKAKEKDDILESILKLNLASLRNYIPNGKAFWESLCDLAASKYPHVNNPAKWNWSLGLWNFYANHHLPVHHCLSNHQLAGPLYLFHAGLGGIDGQDTQYETEGAEGDRSQHHRPTKLQIATAFGYERETSRNECQKKLEQAGKNSPLAMASRVRKFLDKDNLDEARKILPPLRKAVENNFSLTLTATGRPMNDVVMADHVISAAALLKAAASRTVLETRLIKTTPESSWSYRLPMRRPNSEKWPETGFCLLSVSTNLEELMRRGDRIGDLKGYIRGVDNCLERIRYVLEDKWQITGTLYRDQGSLHMAMPYLAAPSERFAVFDENSDEGFKLVTLDDEQCITQSDLNDWLVKTIFGVAEAESTALTDELTLGVRINPMGFDLTSVADGIRWARNLRMLSAASSYLKSDDYNIEMIQTISAKDNGPKAVKDWFDISERPPDICPICNLRPLKTDWKIKACETCGGRRESRLKTWLDRHPTEAKEKHNPVKTIWTADLADSKNRMICLIQGRFFLDPWIKNSTQPGCFTFAEGKKIWENKNWPSISKGEKQNSPGRLRRVWRTTRIFWEELLADLVTDTQFRWNTRSFITVSEDKATLKPGSLFRLNLTNESREAVADSHGRLLILGPPLTSKEMRVRLKALDSENTSNDRLFSLTPEEINIPTVRIVLILLSPTDFMILAPGSKADMVIEKIVKKYQEEMGRVRHRLSLNVGCLHFRDRFPLYLAIDTARRQMARLERARGDKDNLRMQCATANWNLEDKTLQIMDYPVGPGSSFIHILEQKFGAILNMEDVPGTIRDGINKQVEIVEPFYPYLRIEAYPNNIPSNIANSGYQHPVHFNGKNIYLYPSLFSHLVLDRFQRRLEFDTIPDNDMQTPLATLQIPLEAWDQLKGLENYLFDHGISKAQRKAMLEECLRIVLSWKEVPGNTPTVDIANHQDHYIASLFHQLLGVDKWQTLEPEIRQKLGSSWRNDLLFWGAQLGELCRPDT